jgi:NTE family protein
MPFGSEARESGLGLALSGGGFRAALFHLGALWRLNQLGFLPRLDRISSVSGGSITAAWLALAWGRLRFENGCAANFEAEVARPLREFCARTLDVWCVLQGLLLPGKMISDFLREAYEKHLLGEATLACLPDRPRFIFNSTNLGTGVDFRFSKPYAGDYRIGLIPQPDFRVSEAVAASSAFPPFLSPAVVRPDPNWFVRTPGADLYDQVELRRRLELTDGGIYDNLGLETVWNRYESVLVSDAGAPFDAEAGRWRLWSKQLRRTIDIQLTQGRALRLRALIASYQRGERQGAYWGIGTDVREYGLADSLPSSRDLIQELAGLRTRLNHFTPEEQCRLVNWGYAVSDAALRRYVVPRAPCGEWPYPDHALGERLARA